MLDHDGRRQLSHRLYIFDDVYSISKLNLV